MHQRVRIITLLGLLLLALNLHAIETYTWAADTNAPPGTVPVASFTISDADYLTAVTTPGTAVPFDSFTASFTFPAPTGSQSFSLLDVAVIPSVALTASGDVSAFLYNDMGTSVNFGRHFIVPNLPYPPSQYNATLYFAGSGHFGWLWTSTVIGRPPNQGQGDGAWGHESAAVPDSGAMLAMVALGLAGLSGLRLRRK